MTARRNASARVNASPAAFDSSSGPPSGPTAMNSIGADSPAASPALRAASTSARGVDWQPANITAAARTAKGVTSRRLGV
ncbi:MAG: hypothetical protein U0640_11040 [Phycisphaerales bacterium]